MPLVGSLLREGVFLCTLFSELCLVLFAFCISSILLLIRGGG